MFYMRIRSHFAIVLCVVFVSLIGAGRVNGQIVEDKIETVSFCDLMASPNAFVGKMVRTTAVMTPLNPAEHVLTLKCGDKSPIVAVSLTEELLTPLVEGAAVKLSSGQKLSESQDDSPIALVGKFLGPRAPDAKFNHGHYGWSKYLFEIHKFEELSSAKP